MGLTCVTRYDMRERGRGEQKSQAAAQGTAENLPLSGVRRSPKALRRPRVRPRVYPQQHGVR